jgi:RNA polymerase sigma factor (sigma-70 family)
VARLRSGDQDAYRELVDAYRDRIITVCSRVAGPGADAEDLAQDAFLKAFGALDRFDGRSALFTWIYRIAVNTARDWIDHRRRRPVVPLDGAFGSQAEPATRACRAAERPSATSWRAARCARPSSGWPSPSAPRSSCARWKATAEEVGRRPGRLDRPGGASSAASPSACSRRPASPSRTRAGPVAPVQPQARFARQPADAPGLARCCSAGLCVRPADLRADAGLERQRHAVDGFRATPFEPDDIEAGLRARLADAAFGARRSEGGR